MTGKVYVKKEDFDRFNEVKELSYYEFADKLCEEKNKEVHLGNFLRRNLYVTELPEDFEIFPCAVTSLCYTSMPCPDLTLPVFNNAKGLPKDYEESIKHWSDTSNKGFESDAYFYQNPSKEYFIDLNDDEFDKNGNAYRNTDPRPVNDDRMVSEGVVYEIVDLLTNLTDIYVGDGLIDRDVFIPIHVPFCDKYLEEDGDGESLITTMNIGDKWVPEYSDKTFVLYLKLSDIMDAPNPNKIYIDLIHFMSMNYGYYY